MSFSSWTLPLAVGASVAFPLRLVHIHGKVHESQLLNTPTRRVRVRAAGASFLRLAHIFGKAREFRLLDVPARWIESLSFVLKESGGHTSQRIIPNTHGFPFLNTQNFSVLGNHGCVLFWAPMAFHEHLTDMHGLLLMQCLQGV